jgi:predicted LPLAT superfamily acyltransferase
MKEKKREKTRNYSWSGRSLTGLWGEKLFYHFCNFYGRGITYTAIALTIPFFMALRRRERTASFDFFSRVHATSNRWKLLWHTCCHFWCWGACWADRCIIFGGGLHRYRFDRRVDKDFEKILSTNKGLILLTAHLGNYGIGAWMLRKETDMPVNIALIDEEEKQIRRFLDHIQGEFRPGIIRISRSIFSSIPILKALRKGQMVGIQVDRVVDKNVLPVDFFGYKTLFPKGPLLLSIISGAPILICFILKEGWKRYIVFAEKSIIAPDKSSTDQDLILGNLAQKVVRQLELVVRRHPHQWFNFYPYWIDSPGFQDPR